METITDISTLSFLFEAVGIAGAFCIVLAYFLNQSGQLESDQIAFPVLNLAGAILLLISLLWNWNTGSVIIELFWIAISLYGIFRILNKPEKESDS